MKLAAAATLMLGLGIAIGWFTASQKKADAQSEPLSSGVDLASSTNQSTSNIDVVFDEHRSDFERLVAATLAGDSLEDGSFAAQIQSLNEAKTEPHARKAALAIVRRWVKVAPHDAFAYCTTATNRLSGEFRLTLIESWIAIDHEAAIAAVLALPDSHGFKGLMRINMLDSLVAIDPELAFDVALEGQYGGTDKAITAIAQKDIDLALSKVSEVPSAFRQKEVLKRVMTEWVKSDPDAALQHAAMSGEDKDEVLSHVTTLLARTDPIAAVEAVKTHLRGHGRQIALRNVAAEWFLADPQTAIHLAGSLDDPDGAFGNIARRLIESDQVGPKLDAFLSDERAWPHAPQVFEKLAKEDWDTAAEKVLSLENDHLRLFGVEGLLDAMPYTSMERSGETFRWMNSLLGLVENSDTTELEVGWVFGKLETDEIVLLFDEHKNLLVPSLPEAVRAIQARGFEGAVAFLEPFEPSEGKDEAFQEIASNWSDIDPQATADWVGTLPEGEGKTKAYRNVASAWSSFDAQSAKAWIEKLPPSDARTGAIREFVDVQAGHDPAAAVALAQTIDQENWHGKRAMITALTGWVRTEIDTAVEAIESMELLPEISKEIDEVIKQEREWAEFGIR